MERRKLMTNINTDLINQIKQATQKSLSELVKQAVADAAGEIANQPGGYSQTGVVNIYPEREAIAKRFVTKLGGYFDQLTGDKSRDITLWDPTTLSLVGDDDLEAIIAMEGMVAHARNTDISEYLSFTTRLNSLFYGMVIDESNNPLDPEQIGEAFRESMRPISMGAKQLLIVYRKFNICVFHRLEEVLEEANEILISNNVIPNLDMHARRKELQKSKRNNDRPTAVAETRVFADNPDQLYTSRSNPEMLSLMKNLMHGLATMSAVAVPGQPVSAVSAGALQSPDVASVSVGGQAVSLLPQANLFSLLTEIQQRLPQPGTAGATVNAPLDLTSVLSDTLQKEAEDGSVPRIDDQSSDIINLVTLLYKAIWQDESLPIPIKELIGRTQITILKVALSDPEFFNRDQHPARIFLNELAMAGIGWTEVDRLEHDPTYCMMQRLVLRMFNEYQGDLALFDALLAEFHTFKREHEDDSKETEDLLNDADERQRRLEEIEIYVSRKIDERILEEHVDPLVEKILKQHFHRFLVKLVLREGPGGNGWKPVINTIDVLLWTVQESKQKGDKERFKKINPRLLENLGKALHIAGLSKPDIESLLRELLKVQQKSFRKAEATVAAVAQAGSGEAISAETGQPASGEDSVDELRLSDDDEHLQEVERLPVGIWVEFKGSDEQSIRCTLAARIDTIDKFVFVNRQGVKVVEKSRMGLARELKQGSVKIISDHPLIDRAMESVISILREQQSAVTSN